MKEAKYDLEERLLEFAVRIIRVTESMHRSSAGIYVADQLLRSGTSPFGHHGGGSRVAGRFHSQVEGPLQGTARSEALLRLVHRTPLAVKPALLDGIIDEAEELVRIFAVSIRTAGLNKRSGSVAATKTLNA